MGVVSRWPGHPLKEPEAALAPMPVTSVSEAKYAKKVVPCSCGNPNMFRFHKMCYKLLQPEPFHLNMHRFHV